MSSAFVPVTNNVPNWLTSCFDSTPRECERFVGVQERLVEVTGSEPAQRRVVLSICLISSFLSG